MLKKILLALLLSTTPLFGSTVALSCTPGDGTTLSFHFYRSKTSGGPYSQLDIPPNIYVTCAFIDTAVQPGETWYYVSAGVNAVGVSLPSNEYKAVIPALPKVPLSPKGLTGTITP